MSDLKGQPGELRMTIQITRKATGKTETVELVGKVTPEEKKEQTDGGDHMLIQGGSHDQRFDHRTEFEHVFDYRVR